MSSTITDRLKRKREETKDQPIPSYVAGKFKEWVSVNRETGCWEWKLSRQKKRGGYGQKK